MVTKRGHTFPLLNGWEVNEPFSFWFCRSLDPDAPENPPEDTFCDDPTYYKYHESCFKLDTTRRTFADAQEFCQNDGANLASIDDAHCEAFLEYMLYSRGVSDAWIGMQKVVRCLTRRVS